MFVHSLFGAGLLSGRPDPRVLQLSIDRLLALRANLELRGLRYEEDMPGLILLYGQLQTAEERTSENLAVDYFECSVYETASEAERAQRGYPSVDQCRDRLLHKIDEEVARLRALVEDPQKGKDNNAPPAGMFLLPSRVELLIKYKSSVQHSIERLLSQIEGLRRIGNF